MRSIATALLSLALGAGCANLGHVRAEKTADRLGDLSASLEDLRERVNDTSTALAAVVAAKDQDPSSAYGQFEHSVDALESSQRRTEMRLQGVKEYAQAYFVTWKEQASTIEDQDLKERSEERRNELASAVDEVVQEMGPVREQLTAYTAALKDTLKYLSIDLTPQGISAIEGRSKEASKTSKSLHEHLGDMLETTQRVAPQFAQAKAAAPKRGAPAAPKTTH